MVIKNSFIGKNAVVTGANSGIGLCTFEQLKDAGARVIGLDINIADDHVDLEIMRCDVSMGSDVKRVFEEISTRWNCIDILINCAGIQTYGNVEETSEELWDRTLDINLKGAFLACKYAIPHMNKAKNPVIVNVSSVQAFATQERVAAYATSKDGLNGLTRSIAIDYAPHIRCVAIAPGAVDTPMLRDNISEYDDQEAIIKETENIHLLQRIAKTEEIVNFITFLASEDASFATGQVFRVDGGIGLKIEGTVMQHEIRIVDTRHLECGEGPIWDAGRSNISWTDSNGTIILSKRTGKETRVLLEGVQASSLMLHEEGGLAFSSHQGFFHLQADGLLRDISTSCDGRPLTMINDAIADPKGRIYGGQEMFSDEAPYETGYLYMVDLDGNTKIVEEGMHISNGMGFSLSLDQFYLADTIARKIYVYDYRSGEGAISNRRVLVTVDQDLGMPDGLTVDTEGYVWVAMFLGGQICRFDPDGILERTIQLPFAQPTSVIFGGKEMNELFITSANFYWESPLAPSGHDFTMPRGAPLVKIKQEIQGRNEFKVKV